MNSIKIGLLKGNEMVPFLDQLAKLRIRVFKDHPYCYDGNMMCEKKYLGRYAACNESIMVYAEYNNNIIGASTAIPLEFEIEAFKKPFFGENIKKIFYLGESVILPQYRGNHCYQHFFRLREEAARKYACDRTVFCAVDREESGSKKPENYQPLNPVWSHFNYTKNEARKTQLAWKDINEYQETLKDLVFWEKSL